MPTRYGGRDRISAKKKLASELVILGNILARTRESRGLKQSDLSAKLGFPPSYLSKIENGSRRVDVIELMHIAQAMGVEPSEILRELQVQLKGEGPA